MVTEKDNDSFDRDDVEPMHDGKDGNLDKDDRVIFSLEGKFLHVKVGDASRPSGPEDIEEIEGKITDLLNDHNVNALVLVTHHAVEIDVYDDKNKDE